MDTNTSANQGYPQQHIHFPFFTTKAYRLLLMLILIVVGIAGTLLYDHIKVSPILITVEGKDTIALQPSSASIKVDYTATDVTEDAAKVKLQQAIAKLKQSLVSHGIPESAISTTDIFTSGNFTCLGDTCPQAATSSANLSYAATTMTVQFNAKNLGLSEEETSVMQNTPGITGNVESSLSPFSQNGVNYTYKVNDWNAILQKARQRALADAYKKAMALVSLTHQNVGRLVSIHDKTDFSNLPAVTKNGELVMPQTATNYMQRDLTIPVTLSYEVTYETK